MCPDRGQNPQPFGARDATWPGQLVLFLLNISWISIHINIKCCLSFLMASVKYICKLNTDFLKIHKTQDKMDSNMIQSTPSKTEQQSAEELQSGAWITPITVNEI